MPEFPKRDYQTEAIASVHRAWNGERRPTGEGVVNRPAVVLPTGMGKTVVQAEIAKAAHAMGKRPLIMVPREEIQEQHARKINSIIPHASIGIVRADRNESATADIIIASAQTLARARRREAVRNVGIGIADECHHAVADGWRAAMEHFGAWDGSIPWVGFTATMGRSDEKKLGDIWEEICYSKDIVWGIQHGYLSNVRGKRIHIRDLRLDDIKRSRGDMQIDDLGDALLDADTGEALARAIHEHASDRKHILTFTPNVETAIKFTEDSNNAGISAEYVIGSTPSPCHYWQTGDGMCCEFETGIPCRGAIYDRFERGVTRHLLNCMVLTEGFDAPYIDCVIIARPTNSELLHAQMVGRGTRPFPGKHDCLIMYVVGESYKYRLRTLADLIQSTVTPEDDETLIELKKRSDPIIDEKFPNLLEEEKLWTPTGDLVATEIDLFEQSDVLWLQTRGGKWFIPTEHKYFFLWPFKPGVYTLGYMRTTGGKAVLLEKDLTLEYAMAWGEKYASEEDTQLSYGNRKAKWRQGNRAPGAKQIRFAQGLGLPTDGNKRELSDRINIFIGSRLIDR